MLAAPRAGVAISDVHNCFPAVAVARPAPLSRALLSGCHSRAQNHWLRLHGERAVLYQNVWSTRRTRREELLLSLARGERLHGSRQQSVARRRLSEDPLLRRLISRARSSPTSNSRSAWIAIAAPRAARSPNEELCPCAAVSTRPHESTSRHQQRIRQCNSWRTGETYHCAHVRDLGVHLVVVYCC